MAERQTMLFSINEGSLKRMAEYLERDYTESGDWSSPEQLFRNFMKKVAEEVNDSRGVILKSEEYADGEFRFAVECEQLAAKRGAEILGGEPPIKEQG